MRIAPVAGQHRQQHCPQNVPLARCVRATEIQRATRNPAVKQSTLLHVLNEERKLAKRRYPRRVVPFDMDAPRKGVRNRCRGRHPLNCRLLTRRENRKDPSIRRHPSRYQLFRPIRISPTLGSRLIGGRGGFCTLALISTTWPLELQNISPPEPALHKTVITWAVIKPFCGSGRVYMSPVTAGLNFA